MPLGSLSVLIGPNGSGKSNIVSIFKMLRHYAEVDKLLKYLTQQDCAAQFHLGPKRTPNATVCFTISEDGVRDERLLLGLAFTAPAGIAVTASERPKEAPFLRNIRVFQFNDTSLASNVRLPSYVDNSEMLLSDGANLAAVLNRIKTTAEWSKYYERIVTYVTSVFPGFGDFRFTEDPNRRSVRLNWCDCDDPDYIYGPHQLSDGTLRFMALATLLLAPPELLPSVIVIDEPELGLHPAAIGALASMMKIASAAVQVVVATQSPRLLDEFDPSQVLIVERDKVSRSSICRRLDVDSLSEWLAEYSLSDLWEKNLLGGNP